ncbi:hypothetical protein VN12_09745 [Pirellula sp. SH-Sr6A]|uniref:BatD family protein n=1 Tax=Pirellula sp. SH-Sr6A TaxID=1632865 RepID=UPI00078C2A97|nr:BatD family protein [Pirellula sp. SH-Sr6A]AMV32396.1 hypothetical protein VN12_09745 [Pirellula sp. SH-Sr6A]
MIRIPISILTFLFVAICVGTVAAQQQPSIHVDTDADEVFVGESLTLRISLNNMDGVAAPKLDSLQEDFTTELISERPLNQSSTTIINGRVMQRNLYRVDFDYQLTPKRKGSLTVPSISVEFEGKQYRSEPIEIRVLEPAPQDYVFLETNVSKTRVYPTEKFDVTLRILVRGIPDWEGDPVRPLARRPPRLSIPWVETPDGLKGPDQSQWLQTLLSDRNYGFTINGIRTSGTFLFDGPQLALFDLLTGKTKKKIESGEEHEFFVYEITKSMRANMPGRYTFGPAMVKGTFAVAREEERLIAKQIAANSPSVQIEVMEVPTPRPTNYFGGIGDYNLYTALSTSKCRVGDPITLKLTIASAESSLEPVFAPKLTNIPFVADSFEIIDDSPIGQTEGNKKVFEYSLRPKKKMDAIPPLVFQTFDPGSETFKDVLGNAMTIDVEEGAAMNLTSPPSSNHDSLHEERSDSVDITSGTIQSRPVVENILRSEHWMAAVAISWFGSLGVLAIALFRRSIRARSEKRRGALELRIQNQMREIVEAFRRGDTDWACKRMHQSFAEIMAHSPNGPVEGMTTRDIVESAERCGVSGELLDSLRDFLFKLDSRRFSPATEFEDSQLLSKASEVQKSLLEHLSRMSLGENKRFAFGKLAMFWGVFLVTGGSTAMADTMESSWKPLLEQFAQITAVEDFRSLATAMEMLCRQGEPNANAYFHQGNAWFRAGEFGRAIHAYQIANRIAPGDEAILSNLEIARESAPAKGSVLESSFGLGRWFRIPLTWYWERNLAAIAWILAGPVFAWSCLFSRRGPLLASIGAMCLGSCLGLHAWMESPDRYAWTNGVVVRETQLFEGMSERSKEAGSRPLGEGVEFEVLIQTPSWVLGRFPERGEGWVRSQNVRTGR